MLMPNRVLVGVVVLKAANMVTTPTQRAIGSGACAVLVDKMQATRRLPWLDAENPQEKRSLAELMSCIFNAAANTEKMSMTGLQPKKNSEKNLSRNQRKRGSLKEFATRLIDFAYE
jgi:hypothetical protein